MSELMHEIEQLINDIFNHEIENGASKISSLLQSTLHDSLDYLVSEKKQPYKEKSHGKF